MAKLQAPPIGERLAGTAERARAEGWAYEAFLEALLEAELFARDASGARQRIRANRLSRPQVAGALVARRYERGSIVITSNRSFEQWGEILGDAMVAPP